MPDRTLSPTQETPTTTRRRIAAVLGLLVLAPWVGEFLLGNIPLREIAALPFLVPLYGAGALLIREVARRTGRGWPTMLVLGLAYGVIEAGLVDQSLFNPSFEGHEFQVVTPVPLLGISAANAMSFLVGHVVWSIGIPIAIVEILTRDAARAEPWLGRVGLLVTAVAYIGGCAMVFGFVYSEEGFLASPAQQAGAAVAALALVAVAFAIRPGKPPRANGKVPRPSRLGVVSFAYSSVFFARPENWAGVAMGAAMLALAAVAVAHWARQERWRTRHLYALCAGTLLTYAWGGFALTGLIRPHDGLAWIGNAVFALLAVALLAITATAVRSPRPAPGTPSRDG